ncbi:MAG: transporter substrate-binding domain-containing protein [Bermanella sp.]
MFKLRALISSWTLFTLLLSAMPTQAEVKTFSLITGDWYPYIGNKLKNQGWTMEVAKAALESQGYIVTLRLVPWQRAIAESKQGAADALFLSYYVKEREQWYVFSDSMGQARTGFFALKSRHIKFQTLQGLKSLTVGLTRGAAVSPEFDIASFLKKEETADDLGSLRKLLKGRIDLYAGPELVAKHLMKMELMADQRGRIEFLEPPLANHDLYAAISKKADNYLQKLADFNLGLKTIKDNGQYNKILKSHGF